MFLPDIPTLVRSVLQPCVQKGAAWLDETQPGWASKIAPDRLSIASAELCICGQLFGDYDNRPPEVQEANNFGFTLHSSDLSAFEIICTCSECVEDGDNEPFLPSEVSTLAWRALDVLWLDEVYWRLG